MRAILPAVDSIKAALWQAIDGRTDVQLAVLFGSVARAAESRDSDVDVGVLGPASAGLSALRVTLERATGRSVDLIDLRTAPPLLRFEIARDGQVLVERAPHLWSDFKARAMVDWWEWAPLARRFHRRAVARLGSGSVTHGQA
jgi:predicted nucleotidyltransferase